VRRTPVRRYAARHGPEQPTKGGAGPKLEERVFSEAAVGAISFPSCRGSIFSDSVSDSIRTSSENPLDFLDLFSNHSEMKAKVKLEEIVILAQPLPEIPTTSFSLTAFKQKAEEILKRMAASNESFTLTKNGTVLAVVHDWREDARIDQRRCALLAAMESFEVKPKTGKLKELKGRAAMEQFLKLRRAYENIESSRKFVAFSKANLYDNEQTLQNAEQEAARLFEEWEKTGAKD